MESQQNANAVGDRVRFAGLPPAGCISESPPRVGGRLEGGAPSRRPPAAGSRRSCVITCMKSERESRIPVLVWALEAKGNCVAARRGGEQPAANLWAGTKVNSIRHHHWASLRAKGEACGCRSRSTPLTGHIRLGVCSVVVWLELADRDGFIRKIRELPGQDGVHDTVTGSEEPPGRSQSTHSSVEAGNDRGAKGCRKMKT
jgi:hypothetical protein